MGGGAIIKKSYDDIIAKIDNANIYSSKNIEAKQNADQTVANTIAKLGLRLIDNTRKEENK